MKFGKGKIYPEGTKRKVLHFAWLPVTGEEYTYWLQRVVLEQVYQGRVFGWVTVDAREVKVQDIEDFGLDGGGPPCYDTIVYREKA